jgi:hypothetical protein
MMSISIPGFGKNSHGTTRDIGTAALLGGGIVATGTALTAASAWLLEKPMGSPAINTLKAFGVGAIVAGELAGLAHVKLGSDHVTAGYAGAGVGLAAAAGGTAAVMAAVNPAWMTSHGKEALAMVIAGAAVGTIGGGIVGASGLRS